MPNARLDTTKPSAEALILRILPAVLLLLLSSPVATLSQAVNNRPNTPPSVRPEMAINVVTDCGAVGDGVTDDWEAIQACITNHPGKTISFPKMRSVPCVKGSGRRLRRLGGLFRKQDAETER